MADSMRRVRGAGTHALPDANIPARESAPPPHILQARFAGIAIRLQYGRIARTANASLSPQLAFHLCAFAFRRAFQAVEQFVPVNFAGVTDDVQMRQAASFDEVVAILAVRRGGDAVEG